MHSQLFVTRRENRLRQKDMAALLHIDTVTYQRKESGKAVFTLPEAFKIANYFGMSVDELFTNEEGR